MNITLRPHRAGGRFTGTALLAGLCVWTLGVASSPVQAGVPVDQTPLIIQKPLPPNIVLMLDDSGSMDLDYMPDRLSDTSLDGYRNASINGIYYNPGVVYAPPPKADGTSYPASPGLSHAYADGFLDASATDITRFKGSKVAYYAQLLAAGTYKYFFAYTDPKSGVRSYVGQTGDCALLSAADQKVCDDSAAAQQNVANWFSYYRKRILMAKSGVMGAFSTVDASFRVGFGSIDGSNAGSKSLGGDYYAFNTSAQGSTYRTGIAVVKPFGDGSAGTQKQLLWGWMANTNPAGWTPLRGALNAVGTYYGTQQPWLTLPGEAGYVSGTSTELACRQSYTILTTDGFWNGDSPNVGNVDNTAATLKGANSQTYTYTPASPYSDGVGNTLADVAMKYWITDLRSAIVNEVPTSSEDPAFWQHMTTFTLGMGFTPTGIQPAGTTIGQIFDWANGGKAISGFSWPTPGSDSQNNIADLAHAAVNGHGGFYSATSPESFASGLRDALKRTSERVGTGASLAANSTQLKTGTMAYQANYYTSKWKGDLKALAVDPNTGAIAATTNWTASASMPAAAGRSVWTYNPTTKAKVEFKNGTTATPPALSAAQLAALGADATAQAKMVDYLRGDAAQEQRNGGSFRNRDTPLGDIVDSQPIYVGAPDPNLFANKTFAGSSIYLEFASGKAKSNGDFLPSPASLRSGMIYVAANDGMLHGFDAATGAEKFAYIPGAVLTAGCGGTPTAGCGLGRLASAGYGSVYTPHQYFNDGELTVADVYMGSAWKTVLVGTTGRGLAKAIYAFDITDPADIAFLWERSAGDGKANGNYIGQTVGKPVIAQTADGSWSALVGNGYNSVAGKSALLQFELADGTLHVHATNDSTGLAAPAAWMDPAGTGVSTAAYAGDASGNVWSFVLNTSAGTSASATPDSAGVRIFTAVDDNNVTQPITAGLLVGRDPSSGNTWVFFGTGRYLSVDDLTSKDVQSWYGLIVQSATSDLSITASKTRGADLAKREITAEAGNARAATTLGEAAAADASIAGKSGWYMDLTSPVAGAEGERMVTPNQFQSNLLLGTTRIPQASDPCNPSGRGWIMALDPFTGTNSSQSFFDVSGDGKVDANDSVDGKPAGGIGFSSLPNNPIFVGSSMLTSFDNGTTSSTPTRGSTGAMQRVSWRELIAP